ncbi:hypothetical protein ABIF50_001351 [Bradyrhizobium diazoefficiens]
MMAHRDAALAYAARDLFVFQARYKRLKTGKWNKQGRWSGKKTNGLNWAMTKDPIEIQKLWVSHPDDPLGIPTGSVNRISRPRHRHYHRRWPQARRFRSPSRVGGEIRTAATNLDGAITHGIRSLLLPIAARHEDQE